MNNVSADVFTECLKEVYDREYCRGVEKTVMELAETRCVVYRRGRVGYVLILPSNDRPYVRIAVDERKKGLMITLVGENYDSILSRGYTVLLIYKREADRRFRPIHAELINTEIAAMTNSKLPSGVLQRLLSRTQTA